MSWELYWGPGQAYAKEQRGGHLRGQGRAASRDPHFCPFPRTPQPPSMSQRHSDSSLEEKLLEYRFHSELRLDTSGNPASGLPMVRGSLRVRDNAVFQPEVPAPPQPRSPGHEEPRPIVLSTESPAALKLGTQQLIPKSLAVASKAKTPARHQSFGAAVLSREAARRDPKLLPAPSFSLDDMDMDKDPGGMLRRNLRNQSYRAAMKGLGKPGGQGDAIPLSPKLQALAEEPSQPHTRNPAKNKVGACPRGPRGGCC